MHRWGKADPRRGSTADTLAELISPVILCEQTIILENLHHSFNALAHTSLPSPGLAPELFLAHAGRASPRQLRDGHHKKAIFIAEPRKKNRAFLTAPALAGISSDLMQSQEATDDCRQRPIGLRAQAQIRDDGPNMETYHEGTYRRSRVGHADCSPDIRSARRAGCPASRVRFPD
jgi:hypothetical protein